MMWCRTISYRAWWRAGLIAAGLSLASSVDGLAGIAAADQLLLQPTPLILKDGRIASVSIHVVAFPQGQSALESADARELRVLTADVATDCFLTAQVIGHVGSAEVAGSNTLDAHRLARSRADAVQASLIASGLPAKAIASVWDWQFMVREPRATLWVFRLTPGEDCEDVPLDGAGPALVAQAEAGELVAPDVAVPAERGAASTSAAVTPAMSTVIARPAGPSPSTWPVPTVTQALPAVSPSTGASTGAAEVRPPVGTVVALPGRPEFTAEIPAAATRAEAVPAPAQPAATKPAAARQAQARPAPAEPTTTKPAATRQAQAVPAPAQPTAARPAATRQAEAKPAPAEPTATKPAATRQAQAVPAPAQPAATRPAATRQAEAKPAPGEPTTKPAAARQAQAPAPAQPAAAKRADARPTAPKPAEVKSAEVVARAEPAARPTAPDAQPAPNARIEPLAIVFPNNSSYFPPGADDRLRGLLAGLAQGGAYEIALQSSVSGSRKVVGAESVEEAMRYNQWLAERRLERVRDWLGRHASGRTLTFREDYRAGDESRQVMVQARPAG